jgi:general secretion pathway protein B
MSFILDALKKSELERQRQSGPGLMEMPTAARRRGIPTWVWVLAGLLCVNMGVLLVLVLRSPAPGVAHTAGGVTAASGQAPRVPVSRASASRTTPQMQASQMQPSQEAVPSDAAAGGQQSAPAADHFSPLDNQPVYAPEIPVQEESAPQTAATTPNAAPASPGGPARASRRPEPVLADEPPENDEMLPTISELNLTGAQTLPDIHLDVHVYATRAADRFVYINMRKYREGAVLQEGPTLERIRRDGVVLNYNGLRFLVPRQ